MHKLNISTVHKIFLLLNYQIHCTSFIFVANIQISFKFNNVSRNRFVSPTGNETEFNPLHLSAAFECHKFERCILSRISNENEIDRDVNLCNKLVINLE